MRLTGALKKYVLSPFLIVLFSFIHAYNYSYKWMLIADIVDVCFYSLFITFVVYHGFKFIFKSGISAALFTSFIALLFFYVGFFQDWVQKITGFYFQFRYLIPVSFVILISVFFAIKKHKESGRIVKLNYFLNILFLVYILVDIGIISYKKYTMPHRRLTLMREGNRFLPDSTDKKNTVKPDIYFLVFDEYSSSVSLKENYGFDNSGLDSFLLKKGFFISTHSKSNYTYTIFSISSTFHMNYFNKVDHLKYPDDFGLAWARIYNNKVFYELQNAGYDMYNYSFFDFKNYPALNQSFSKQWALKYVFGKSMKASFDYLYSFMNAKHYTKKLEHSLAEFEKAVDEPKSEPKFIYFHVALPHTPYVFRANGEEKSPKEYSGKDKISKQAYVEQVEFTNTVIKRVIDKLTASGRPKIIILEGDHGNRFYPKTDSLDYAKYIAGKNTFKNLNAYYFYDKDYSKLYDSISPVNSFRVVFSQYLNKNFPLLKDSAVY